MILLVYNLLPPFAERTGPPIPMDFHSVNCFNTAPPPSLGLSFFGVPGTFITYLSAFQIRKFCCYCLFSSFLSLWVNGFFFLFTVSVRSEKEQRLCMHSAISDWKFRELPFILFLPCWSSSLLLSAFYLLVASDF